MDKSMLQEMRILAGIESGRPTLPKPVVEKKLDEMAVAADKFSANGWARLAEFQSMSNPSKKYAIGLRQLKSGEQQIGCSCPAWIYAKGEKKKAGCKHISAFLSNNWGSECSPTPFGTAWLAKHKGLKAGDLSATESKEYQGTEVLQTEDFHWHDLPVKG